MRAYVLIQRGSSVIAQAVDAWIPNDTDALARRSRLARGGAALLCGLLVTATLPWSGPLANGQDTVRARLTTSCLKNDTSQDVYLRVMQMMIWH